MSHREKRTIALSHGNTYEQDYTVHKDEIKAMRDKVLETMKAHPDVTTCPDEQRKDAVILMSAAALLEVHDDTGISLDAWMGPLELVHEALWLIGLDKMAFLPNGV